MFAALYVLTRPSQRALTAKVLIQPDDLLKNLCILICDVAEDKGEHVVSLQRDQHAAAYVVGAPYPLHAGLRPGEAGAVL